MLGAGGTTTTAAAYCTIWALVAMLLSFRALMALTILFLLLLVEGWGHTQNATRTQAHIRITRLQGNGGGGLMVEEARVQLRG